MRKPVFFFLFLLLCPLWNFPSQQSGGMKVTVQGGDPDQPRQPLTNESVMGLTKIGFSDETIVSMIEHGPGNYSLRADDVTALKKAGVSEKVITAMSSKMGIGPTLATQVAAPVAPQTATERAASKGPGAPSGHESAEKSLDEQTASAPLTNKDVVDMLKAGLTSSIVVAKIKTSTCSFDTSPAGLQALKAASVPDEVILIMVANPSGTAKAAAPPRLTDTQDTSAAKAGSAANLTIRVALVDKDLNIKPVPQLALKITDENGSTPVVEARTKLDGSVILKLAPGRYRIESSRPVLYQGKSYLWRIEALIGGQDETYELTNENATIVAAPTGAISPSDRSRDNLTDLYQKYRNSVVTVWSEIGHGTGFIFDSNGLILTNQHVIGASEFISVQFDETRKVRAKLLSEDPERDVAVLLANLDAFPDAIPALLWKSETGKAAVVEGEKVLAIGSPLSQRKIMTTGIVSKVEPRAIISDVNINPGNSGGPLFNSVGYVVGLTTFHEGSSGPGIAGIVRIEEAYSTIAKAREKLATESAPPKTLLPVEPAEKYPVAGLKQVIQRKNSGNSKRYFLTVGDFDVAIITPVFKYRMMTGGELAGSKELNKRLKKANEDSTLNPLDDLRDWAEYAGEYSAVISIRAHSHLHETFLSGFSRTMAAASGSYGGPARLKFKNDFKAMRLLCNSKEIQPIHPGKIAHVLSLSNSIVQVSDASYEGFYSYPPDAISPSCKEVALEIESVKKGSKPERQPLDRKAVQQVWDDFGPYRAQAKNTEVH